MELTPFVLLLAICPGHFINGYAEFERYSQKTLETFFHSLKTNVDHDCQQGIDRLLIYLNETESAAELIRDAYVLAPTAKFANEQDDRWIHSGISCVMAASGTFGISHGRRYQHCQAHLAPRSANPGQTISICIPEACSPSRKLALKFWFDFTQNLLTAGNSTHNSSATRTAINEHVTPAHGPSEGWKNVTFSKTPDCLWSSWETEWYKRWYTVIITLIQGLTYGCVVAATIYQLKQQKQRPASENKYPNLTLKERLIYAFSAKLNLDKVLKVPSKGSRSISSLYGVRFLAICWIFFGHTYVVMFPWLSNTEQFVNQISKEFLSMIIVNFDLSVDIFFLMTGCLASFGWFCQITDLAPGKVPTWRSWRFWLKYFRHRLFRIWPTYFCTLLLTLFQIQYLSHRRMAPVGEGIMASAFDVQHQCRDHVWENLFFLNSLLPNLCLPSTWYIGTEMVFFFLSPLMLLLIHRSPRLSGKCGLVLILASSLLRGTLTAMHNFPPRSTPFNLPGTYSQEYVSHYLMIYVKPYTRIGPYLVGIGLGYLLATKNKLPASGLLVQLAGGWILSAALGVWSVFGFYPALQNLHSGGWYWHNLAYASFFRTSLALAVAWVIFVCHMGRGWLLNTVLSFKIFGYLGNLCYTFYLWHFLCIMVSYAWSPYPMTWTGHGYHIVFLLIGFVLSYCTSLLISLTIEIPCINLEKIICDRKRTQNPTGEQNKTLEKIEHVQLVGVQ